MSSWDVRTTGYRASDAASISFVPAGRVSVGPPPPHIKPEELAAVASLPQVRAKSSAGAFTQAVAIRVIAAIHWA